MVTEPMFLQQKHLNIYTSVVLKDLNGKTQVLLCHRKCNEFVSEISIQCYCFSKMSLQGALLQLSW